MPEYMACVWPRKNQGALLRGGEGTSVVPGHAPRAEVGNAGGVPLEMLYFTVKTTKASPYQEQCPCAPRTKPMPHSMNLGPYLEGVKIGHTRVSQSEQNHGHAS